MIPTISPIVALLAAPICIVTACIAKLVYKFTRINQFGTSRKAYVKHMSDYLRRECLGDGFTSEWVLRGSTNSVHVLCRYSTIFSGEPPIFIIPSGNKCALDYMEFIKTIPKYHDVFCIDLPGWGTSEPLQNVDLCNDELPLIFKSYATMLHKTMTEICPIRGQTFTLIGDAFGAYLLVQALSSGIIPPHIVRKCILCELPGISADTLRQPYLRGIAIKIGLLNVLNNSWFFKRLCCAFLYERTVTPSVLSLLRNFIPNKYGYKMIARNIRMRYIMPPRWNITVKESLMDVSTDTRVILIHGINDSVVSCEHAKRFCEEAGHVRYVEVLSGNDLLSDETNFKKVFKII